MGLRDIAGSIFWGQGEAFQPCGGNADLIKADALSPSGRLFPRFMIKAGDRRSDGVNAHFA
jgi:hypothetical protein